MKRRQADGLGMTGLPRSEDEAVGAIVVKALQAAFRNSGIALIVLAYRFRVDRFLFTKLFRGEDARMALDRRTTLATAGLALVATPLAAAATNSKGATFVLIPRTWLGGLIWADVAERLRQEGHRVFTPTLSGVGERRHLASPAIGLDTHITDIVNVIDFEELSDVILIGHGFSGVAMTGVADARRDRIAHTAFFDALIPHPGRMTALEMTANGDEPDYFRLHRKDFIEGYLMDFLAVYPMRMLVADDRPAIQDSIRRRITPHPCKPWTDALILKNGGWAGLPRT